MTVYRLFIPLHEAINNLLSKLSECVFGDILRIFVRLSVFYMCLPEWHVNVFRYIRSTAQHTKQLTDR